MKIENLVIRQVLFVKNKDFYLAYELIDEIDNEIDLLAKDPKINLIDVVHSLFDICIRSAGISYVPSYHSTVRSPVSPLYSVGRLTFDAAETAMLMTQYSTKLRQRLQDIQNALNDYVFSIK